MRIPFVDLKSQYNQIKTEIDQAISDVISETSFIGGDHVNEFEKKFAKLYGVKHCVSLANGTDALYVSMKMLDIGWGDEVITTAYSWISSSETITQTGAKPVFVDVDEYFTIDSSKLEQKINSRTKAIIPVHIHGQMCNMDIIMKIADKYNIPVIEDCAQSHFSEYKGKRAGTIGLVGTFSFYPGKNLGAYGDAGCLITNDNHFATKCKMFARHGALIKHQHEIEGINSRLDGIQAAILNVKLPHILDWTKCRIENAKLYNSLLKDISQIETPKVRDKVLHSYHLYVIKTQKRNELAKYLNKNGVDTDIHYPVALPNMNAYKYLKNSNSDFPISYSNQNKILSLPMFPELTFKQIEYISKLIKAFFKNEQK